MNGDKKTGVTSMLMEEGLDTGDMLITAETDIDINETVSELHDRLSEMGSDVLIKTIEALKEGKLNPQKQDDSKSCYAPMITKDMCRIDFSDTAINIHNKIRAITGYTILNGKRLKLYRTQICDRVVSGCECGSIVDEKSLTVVCGDGKCITLLEVQPEGSKRMKTEDFLRGNKLTAGIKFE